jgi:RimJ/RimL family protein N-acetyltransferase
MEGKRREAVPQSAPLLTARLRLRRLRPSDEPDLIALDSDPEVMRYVGSPPGVRPPAETVARARQRIGADQGPYGWWRVEGRDDGAFHGLGLLLPMPDGDGIEVGYRLARASWRRGIATEAAAALVEYALGGQGLPSLAAVVYPDNAASRRVLGKLGFAPDGPCEYNGARVLRYVLAAAAWRARAP